MAAMTKTPAVLFWIASVGMEIAWLYAWAAFTMGTFAEWLYPLPMAAAVFILASLVTTAVRGRGWRVFQILLVHGAGLMFFIFQSAHALWYPSDAFWSPAWVENLLNRERVPLAWITLAAVWGWTFAFWIIGIGHGLRSKSYLDICSRFDKGLGWLFALLFIKLLLRIQPDGQSIETLSEMMIFPLFVFGLLAVTLARNRNGSQKVFSSGYRGIGLTVGFCFTVLLCGAGFALLF